MPTTDADLISFSSDKDWDTDLAHLDIIIPALDEEQRIGETLIAIDRELRRQPFPARIIVVDNGCVDGTVDVVASMKISSRIEVISCSEPGKGAAVRAGVMHSTAPYVAYCDADLSTPPSTLGVGMELVLGGAPAVVGSRTVDGARVEVPQSLVRRIGSRAFNLAAAGLVGSLKDTQCGFKIFDGTLVRSVFTGMKVDGYAFDVELIARLLCADIPVVELPVRWSDDKGTRLRMVGDGARAFRDVYKVRHILRGEGLARSA